MIIYFRQHRLFKAIHDKIPALMELNAEETLKLLLDFQVIRIEIFIIIRGY